MTLLREASQVLPSFEHFLRDLPLDFQKCRGSDDGHSGQLTEVKIRSSVRAKKIHWILRLPGPREQRIRVHQESNVRTGNTLQHKANIGSHEPMIGRKVCEFIVDIPVEDDDICAARQGLGNNKVEMQAIEQVKKESCGRYMPCLHIFVAAVQWSIGGPDAFVALEETMACGFAKTRPYGYIVPKRKQQHTNASFSHAVLKSADLSAFAGAINS